MIKNEDSSIQPLIQEKTGRISGYFRECGSNQPPNAVIDCFSSLFFQGRSDLVEIDRALEVIITSSWGQQNFNLIINNCCYLIIDCWSTEPKSLLFLEELVAVLDSVESLPKSYDRRRNKIRQLIKDYRQTELYVKLQFLVTLFNSELTTKLDTEALLSSLIPRYSYLYPYLLPDYEQISKLENLVTKLQEDCQKSFEFKLSQYIIYRTRLKQVASMKLLSRGADKVIYQSENPTLLSEKKTIITMKQYINKIERENTLLQLSQQFVSRNQIRNSYKEFKVDLYQYLIYDFQPRRSSYQFNHKLKQKIDSIFPQSNERTINQTLILQTCRQLLSFIILESAPSRNTKQFTELIKYFGTTQTVYLLIKIILICPEAKPDLAKKIFGLYLEYHGQKIKDTSWLVKILEQLLIAFSLYFGKIDVSIAKTI